MAVVGAVAIWGVRLVEVGAPAAAGEVREVATSYGKERYRVLGTEGTSAPGRVCRGPEDLSLIHI